MKTKRLVISLILAFCFLVACDPSWPPRKNEYVSNFYLQRAEIEKLEAEFVLTDYAFVDSIVLGEARAEIKGNSSVSSPVLDGNESTRWATMLAEAGLTSISAGDGFTTFGIGWSMGIGDSFGAGYIHAPGQSQKINECKDEYANIGCGACGIYLDQDWWVHFEWTNYLSDDQIEEWLSSGTLNDEENVAAQRAAEQACGEEGRRVLGYPPSEP